jgi:hypothetical protein
LGLVTSLAAGCAGGYHAERPAVASADGVRIEAKAVVGGGAPRIRLQIDSRDTILLRAVSLAAAKNNQDGADDGGAVYVDANRDQELPIALSGTCEVEFRPRFIRALQAPRAWLAVTFERDGNQRRLAVPFTDVAGGLRWTGERRTTFYSGLRVFGVGEDATGVGLGAQIRYWIGRVRLGPEVWVGRSYCGDDCAAPSNAGVLAMGGGFAAIRLLRTAGFSGEIEGAYWGGAPSGIHGPRLGLRFSWASPRLNGFSPELVYRSLGLEIFAMRWLGAQATGLQFGLGFSVEFSL